MHGVVAAAAHVHAARGNTMIITKAKFKQLIKEELDALKAREEDPLDEVLDYVNEQDDYWPGFKSMEALDDWVGKPTEPSDPDLVTKRINALKMKEMIDDLSTSFPRVAEALAARDYETLGEMAQGMYTHHQQGRMEGSPHMQRKALMALNLARSMDPVAQGIWEAIGGARVSLDLRRKEKEYRKRMKEREHRKRMKHWWPS